MLQQEGNKKNLRWCMYHTALIFDFAQMYERIVHNEALGVTVKDVAEKLKEEGKLAKDTVSLWEYELAFNENGHEDLWREYMWSRHAEIGPLIMSNSPLAESSGQPSLFHSGWRGPQAVQCMAIPLIDTSNRTYHKLKKRLEAAGSMKKMKVRVSCQDYTTQFHMYARLLYDTVYLIAHTYIHTSIEP